jgi:hypothetical protein
MKPRDYQATIKAKTSAEEAFLKINKVSQWWTKGFSGKASKLGDRFAVRFGETFVDFEIVELNPNMRIVWEVTNCNLAWITNKTEWKGTRVVWELGQKNGTTEVRMAHVGLFPGVECYDACKPGWDFYVTKSLQKLLSEGVGLPDREFRVSA